MDSDEFKKMEREYKYRDRGIEKVQYCLFTIIGMGIMLAIFILKQNL